MLRNTQRTLLSEWSVAARELPYWLSRCPLPWCIPGYHRSVLGRVLLKFNDGLDSDLRVCNSDANAGGRDTHLYIQVGSAGVNDLEECAGRGICLTDTGQCKCFRGFGGPSCSVLDESK